VERGERLGGRWRVGIAVRAHLALQIDGDLAEDRLLGLEVAVERAVRGAGPAGDVGDVRGQELLLGEDLGGRLDERGARQLAAARRRDHAGPSWCVAAVRP
jgi:hypothetical protein